MIKSIRIIGRKQGLAVIKEGDEFEKKGNHFVSDGNYQRNHTDCYFSYSEKCDKQESNGRYNNNLFGNNTATSS